MIKKALLAATILAVSSPALAQSPVIGLYFQANEDAAPPLNHGWQFRARTLSALGFPVPTLQPTTPGVPIAMDMQPLGPNPVELPNNGWGWLDICNADVMHNNSVPVTCGRLGIATINGAPAGYVGTDNFNGAPTGNFWIRTGQIPRWGVAYNGNILPYVDAQYSVGVPLNRVTEVYTVDGPVLALIRALSARITALENR